MEVITPQQLSSPLYDLLQGDMSVYKSQFTDTDFEKIKVALDYLTNNENLDNREKDELIANSWRIHYRVKPPTPEEFLTEKYLGRMAENVWPQVRKWFIEFFDESATYRNAVLYPFIGSGKSTTAVLINLYICTHLALMRNPKKSFNLAPSTRLGFVLASYNLSKASEVLLQPFMDLLDESEFFEKQRTVENMRKAERRYQQEDNIDKIYWTTASLNGVSAMLFSNQLYFKLVSSVPNLLGITIVCGTMTELAFFREAGKSDEYIMRFFNDMKRRVDSRMRLSDMGRYWGRSILDSSPNDLESPVDKYAMFDSLKDPKNYVVTGSRWKWIPGDYINPNDTFPIFKGGSGKPPLILTNTEGYSPEDILWAPKEDYQAFHDDLRKSMKDLAGIPQGSLDKIFYDYKKIDECFVDTMKSVEFCIKADARMPPHDLIWNEIQQQTQNQLFIKTERNFHYYYKPRIPRVFHIDQSVSNDMTAIAFVHVERKPLDPTRPIDLGKDVIYIVDFVVAIHPFGGRINLDAVKEFIADVYTKGGLPIIKGSYDTYQSEASIQYLERFGLEMDRVSVDETLDPYMFLAQLIEQGNLKLGRNIFFKNNLKSLRIVPTKIAKRLQVNHTVGDVVSPADSDYNWDTSLLGYNAKDVSDAVAGAVYNAKLNLATEGSSLVQTWDTTQIIRTPDMIKQQVLAQLKMMGLGSATPPKR